MSEIESLVRPNGELFPRGSGEGLLRLAGRLATYPGPESLFLALPEEVHNLIRADAVAAVSACDLALPSWSGVDGEGRALAVPSQIEAERSSLSRWLALWADRQSKEPVRDARNTHLLFLHDTHGHQSPFAAVFQQLGCGCLCVAPLTAAARQFGALFVAKRGTGRFSKAEEHLYSLAAEIAALALAERVTQAEFEKERTKLSLILDLNNSVVSNLELRNVLQSISPSIRRTMRLDGVVLVLPDAESKDLKTYALDFPNSRGVLHEDMSSPVGRSLAGEVFRSGRPWVGDIGELRNSGFDHRIASGEGVETLCMLPLTRGPRVLGVLCLVRLQKSAFAPQEVEFLLQIAGPIAIAIDNALAYRRTIELQDKLTQQNLYLEDEIRSEMNFEEIVGNSSALRKVLQQVEAVAPTGSTVLIHGETGTGKELIARAVHNLSDRRAHAFVRLNCAAIPTGLLESELFGHEKGAFTGAISQRIGRFELAAHGTIFLDEVGEIPLELQPKLLRVLQEREFERLGGSRTFRTDARLIAATNRNLKALVDESRFRSDLFYRLNVFPIEVPPLRERREDIPFLVRHFAQSFARTMKKPIDTISSETMNALARYPWPGNIRELQNVIERAVILSKGPMLRVPLADLKAPNADGQQNGLATLEEMERRHILAVVEQCNWVFAGPNGAAARLGMKRPTLQFRMRKLGISRPPKPPSANK